MTYNKYIILIIISLLVSFFHAEGNDNASNKFAKEAEAVSIIVGAEKIKHYSKATITISNLYSDKWTIIINADNQDFVKGEFTLNYAATYNRIVVLQGKGINEVDGKEIQFDLFSSNHSFGFAISLTNNRSYLNSPYTKFKAGEYPSWTSVNFRGRDPLYYTGYSWKTGTFKQLKECLLENLYVDRY